MGFNAKAFATGFLGDQAKQINQRIIEARDYKRELKDNAEEGKTKIEKLQQLKGLALSEISRLRALGFEDKHINAAIASGPKGLFDLSQSAQQEAGRRDFTPGQKFDEYEIESLIDYSDSFAYGDVRSEEFYEMNTALSKPSLGSTQAPERGLMKTLLGIDLDDSVRARLDKDAYYDGYSVMDINEISKQETYDSVAPGTYFSFTPTSDFDPARASSSFMTMLSAIDRDISDKRDSGYYIRQAQAQGATPQNEADVAARLAAQDKSQAIFNQVQILTESNPTYLDKMGPVLDRYLTDDQMGVLEYGSLEGDNLERKLVKDLLDNVPSAKKDIENTFTINHRGIKHQVIVGTDGTVKSLIMDGNVLEETEIDTILKDMATAGSIPNARLASDTDTEPTEVPTTDDLNLDIKVPPRPNAFTSRFTGVSLDYDTRQKILNGEMDVPDNLRVDEWDELFGETHDPETGNKLGEETEVTTPESEVEEENTRSNPYSFPESMSNADKNKAYDDLPSGAFFIHPDTNQLMQKE
tara:strand:- start:855 stop:2432 length:1578 start_codon:yes stop_codon:yes gene_type:complete